MLGECPDRCPGNGTRVKRFILNSQVTRALLHRGVEPGIAEAMAKTRDRKYIILDVTSLPDFKAQLEKEAAADKRDLTNYVWMLLETHPARTKAKAKVKK